VRENGGDLEAAARLLGRSSIETTRAYVKWADEGLRRIVDGW
jgi:site-specific recombinase XerD